MKRSTIHLLMNVLSFVAVIASVVLVICGLRTIAIVVFVVFFIALLFLKANSGCKHCGYIAPKDRLDHEYCPKCGKPYED